MALDNPTAYWNFEPLITTGFEGDTDLVTGMVIGTNALLLDYPAPSISGKDGNGRLLASYNSFSMLATGYTAVLTTIQTDPFSISFWWRPLVEPTAAGQRVFGIEYDRVSSVPPGSTTIPISLVITKGSGDGLFNLVNNGATVATDVAMTFRDWNLICITYPGGTGVDFEGIATFYVNNVAVGTQLTATREPESAGGRLFVAKDMSGNTGTGLLIAGIDELAIWCGYELTVGDLDDIFNGWVYEP